MLEAILSGARQPIACDDYVLVRAYDGQDSITFSLSRRDPAAQVLEERTRVYETTEGQTYYVSGVDGGQTTVDYVLKKDLSDWEKTAYPGYTNGSKDATAQSTITGVLPAGWTLETEEPGEEIKAYLTLQGPTPLEVALQCMDTYGCALEFDNQKKVAHLHYPGKKTLGSAFLVETANLRQAPEYKSKAGSLVTRLYAQGADGIDFAAVNDGKNYVECFDYTDEVVAGFWRDDRYTVPEHLLTAAKEKIKSLAQPERSWVLSVCDLHGVDPEAWPDLQLNLYDVVRLVDPSLGQTMEAQITELRLCPYYPDRNEISITNVSGTLGKTGAASLLSRTQGSLYGDLVLTVDQVKKDLVDTGGVAVNAATIAQAAQEAANNAQYTANTAQTAADSAQSAADNAQSTADSAQATADDAQQRVEAVEAQVDTLEADVAEIGTLMAEKANISDLTAATAQVEDLKADVAELDTLVAGKADVSALTAATAQIADLAANKADVSDLTAAQGEIARLDAEKLTAQDADLAYAKIDLGNVANGTFGTALIGEGAVGTAQIADGSITDAKIVSLTANKLTAGTIDAGTIDVVNLNAANLTVGKINGTQVAEGTIDTGNLTDGAVTGDKIAAQAVTADHLTANAVTAEKIVSGAVTTEKLAAESVTANQLAAGAITAGSAVIASGAIGSAQIADGAITNVKIGSAAVDTAQIADGAITNAKIGSAAVDTAQIASGAITSAKIGSAAVGSAQIATGAITSAKIGSAAVTTAKIADASITEAKISGKLTAAKIDVEDLMAQDITATGSFRVSNGHATMNLSNFGSSSQGYHTGLSSDEDLLLSSDCAVVVMPGTSLGSSGYSGMAVEGDLLVTGDLQCDNVIVERRERYHTNDGTTVDNAGNEVSFDYDTSGSGFVGPILSIATLGGDYRLQLTGDYFGRGYGIRTKNGDYHTWNSWNTLLHTGNVQDYVVSQGTSGIWRYRVYSSGVKECWASVTVSVTSQASWGYGYLGYTAYQSFPFTFARTPTVNVSVGGAAGLWASLGTVNTTQVESYIMGFQSLSGKSVPIYIHAIG